MTSLSTSTPSQSKMTRSMLDCKACTCSGLIVFERNAIQLEPMIDQFVVELAGDFGLQLFDLLVGEFDTLGVPQVEEMIRWPVPHLLVTGPALADVMPCDNPSVLEQLDRPIHR